MDHKYTDELYQPETGTEEQIRRSHQRERLRKRRLRELWARRLRNVLTVMCILLLTLILLLLSHRSREQARQEMPDPIPASAQTLEEEPEEDTTRATDSILPEQDARFSPVETARTVRMEETEEIYSRYAVVMDSDGTILAEKNADVAVSPASMTKVLTLLLAAELIPDLDTPFTMSREIGDYCLLHDCSVAGFVAGETVPLRDMFYAAILPSGADGALALAISAAGSEEAFVNKMNERARDLGLSAHFTNCIGLYAEDHTCSVCDMAVILKAAMDNPLCREILGTRVYQTSVTEQHPEGLALSNWFIRRIEDRFVEGSLKVRGGKTGFVNQSGSCAASFAQHDDGREYICVSADAPGSWRAIEDHTALYRTYCA